MEAVIGALQCVDVGGLQCEGCRDNQKSRSAKCESNSVESGLDDVGILSTGELLSSTAELDENFSTSESDELMNLLLIAQEPLCQGTRLRVQTIRTDKSTQTKESLNQEDTSVNIHHIIVSLHIFSFFSYVTRFLNVEFLLLALIRSLLLWLSLFIDSEPLLKLRDLIPSNMYYLRKICESRTVLIVCPKCSAIHDPNDYSKMVS